MMSVNLKFSRSGEKCARRPQVLRHAAGAQLEGRLALPSIRDFMPFIIAGLLMIAAACGFIGVNFERIADAVAYSEARI